MSPTELVCLELECLWETEETVTGKRPHFYLYMEPGHEEVPDASAIGS